MNFEDKIKMLVDAGHDLEEIGLDGRAFRCKNCESIFKVGFNKCVWVVKYGTFAYSSAPIQRKCSEYIIEDVVK